MPAADLRLLRGELGLPERKKVVVAGSIHKGEEGFLLGAFREVRKTRDDILLVLAPRHPEKFNDLEKDFSDELLVLRRRTKLVPGQAWDVLFLDTIGELARFYALSDAAFIGGSLIPWGGQNLLEPAFYGKPVFFGPYMKNFADLADAFVRAGGARIVQTPEEIAEIFLFRDPDEMARMGRKALATLISLQGATGKTMTALGSFMPRSDG
jgi:3-deoxy-D-manno-octulosonic-acid transferase